MLESVSFQVQSTNPKDKKKNTVSGITSIFTVEGLHDKKNLAIAISIAVIFLIAGIALIVHFSNVNRKKKLV